MKRNSFIFALGVLAALIALPLLAWAQQEVLMTGQDSAGTTRTVSLDTSGQVHTKSVGHLGCTNTTMNVGTTGTACPASPRTDRTSLLIQLIQTGETLTVTSDGTTTASATEGAQLASGETYADNLLGSVSTSCRCTAATCSVRIVECP